MYRLQLCLFLFINSINFVARKVDAMLILHVVDCLAKNDQSQIFPELYSISINLLSNRPVMKN